ncbi:hypothetical protein ABF87_03085 [Nitrosomonas sp. JL21]|uniref:ubiquinone biosynthesis accessory factor UbiJ n=1 Tax=Nitrosomonas sp. JL21 TaxID=153949 RepID=UPI0013693EC4|nr:hypothetical protein [Nitrosomonas sp. JL21]MBL8496276.1 hypothetical protein [Nitrosomonas sp.]MXS76957.1 hypothetical protein [Nitrosomonas sp. JL21]
MLSTLAITSINHVLRSEHWACKRLQSFSGQTACIQILPWIHVKVLINSRGEIQNIDDSIDTDVTIILPSPMHPDRVTRELSFGEAIHVIGNQSLADELIAISKQFNISRTVEHDLSKVVGDIPAHRLTRAGKNFLQWHTENFDALSQALAEYLTEENQVLAKTDAINQLIRDIQNLQHHVEAFDHRVNCLAESMNALSENPTG